MERKILNLFLKNHRLKFNEIEKNLDIRSNKLAYHLKKLVEKGVLLKEGESYSLSETSEYIIPYLSEKNNVLSIILIKIGNKKEVFLYKREKRPFKDFLSLPGGRLLIGESINSAVKRIMQTKHEISANLVKINSVSLENIKKGSKIINSFMLIFVEAKTKDKIDLININKNKSKIITSDYNLINSKNNSDVKIDTIITKKY